MYKMIKIHINEKNNRYKFLGAYANMITNEIFIDGFTVNNTKKHFNNNTINAVVHIINHECLHLIIKDIDSKDASKKLDDYIQYKSNDYQNINELKKLGKYFLW